MRTWQTPIEIVEHATKVGDRHLQIAHWKSQQLHCGILILRLINRRLAIHNSPRYSHPKFW